MRKYDDDLDLYGYIIDKHVYGGYTCRVQNLKQGEVDTCSSFDLAKIEEWLRENWPQATCIHIQE